MRVAPEVVRRVVRPGVEMHYLMASSKVNFEAGVAEFMKVGEVFEWGPGFVLNPATKKACPWGAVKPFGALGVCHPKYVRFVWVKIRKKVSNDQVLNSAPDAAVLR